jgi:hypothetical protein
VGRKRELDDLIAAFGRRVQEDHPNPARIGCPGGAALTELLAKPGAMESALVLDHVRLCAACLDDLKNLRLARNNLL